MQLNATGIRVFIVIQSNVWCHAIFMHCTGHHFNFMQCLWATLFGLWIQTVREVSLAFTAPPVKNTIDYHLERSKTRLKVWVTIKMGGDDLNLIPPVWVTRFNKEKPLIHICWFAGFLSLMSQLVQFDVLETNCTACKWVSMCHLCIAGWPSYANLMNEDCLVLHSYNVFILLNKNEKGERDGTCTIEGKQFKRLGRSGTDDKMARQKYITSQKVRTWRSAAAHSPTENLFRQCGHF